MSNQKQSSIEWLVEKIQQANPLFKFDSLIRKAKAMEKQQITEAYRAGVEDERYEHLKLHGDYYKKTYGDNTP
jgi:hypothetical protein